MDKILDYVADEYEKLDLIERKELLDSIDSHDLKVCKSAVVHKLVKMVLELVKNQKEAQKMGIQDVDKKIANIPPVVENSGKDQQEIKREVTVKNNGEKQMTLQDIMLLGEQLYKARYFSDIQNQSQAVAKIIAGRELGIGAMTSLSKLYVVGGKVAVQAELMADMIKRSEKYDYRVEKLTNDECSLLFFEKGKQVGITKFTIEDARRAGVADKDVWKRYPKNLLFARALSNGARWYCPDAIHGAYTYEEMGLDIDSRGAAIKEKEIIEVEPIKQDEQKQVQEFSRKEILIELKKNYGEETIKKVKKNLEIKEKLLEIDSKTFDIFVGKLKNMAQ